MLTALTRRLGFWIISCASFMNSAKAVPLVEALLKVRKHLVPHQGQHAIRAKVPELRPAQALLIVGETALEWLARPLQAVLVARLVDIQQTREHEERDLLDHGQRVGNAPLPELRPEGIYAALQFSRNH